MILFFSLRGQPPFTGAAGTGGVLFERIRSCAYDDCAGEEWKVVSDEAKDLIRKLLVLDHRSRLTAELVLQHPWVQNPEVAAACSFRLEESAGGIERLASNREVTRNLSSSSLIGAPPGSPSRSNDPSVEVFASPRVSDLVPEGERSSHSPLQIGSPPQRRSVSFANETWSVHKGSAFKDSSPSKSGVLRMAAKEFTSPPGAEA